MDGLVIAEGNDLSDDILKKWLCCTSPLIQEYFTYVVGIRVLRESFFATSQVISKGPCTSCLCTWALKSPNRRYFKAQVFPI